MLLLCISTPTENENYRQVIELFNFNATNETQIAEDIFEVGSKISEISAFLASSNSSDYFDVLEIDRFQNATPFVSRV